MSSVSVAMAPPRACPGASVRRAGTGGAGGVRTSADPDLAFSVVAIVGFKAGSCGNRSKRILTLKHRSRGKKARKQGLDYQNCQILDWESSGLRRTNLPQQESGYGDGYANCAMGSWNIHRNGAAKRRESKQKRAKCHDCNAEFQPRSHSNDSSSAYACSFVRNRHRAPLFAGGYRASPSRRKVVRTTRMQASRDPYNILGVPLTASEKEIKQAYRKLTLKYHPDVNKKPDAQQQFLEIKDAYQTLIDRQSRAKYDGSKRDADAWNPFRQQTQGRSGQTSKKEEEFYGFGDFFRDLQADRAKKSSTTKPKTLWEELAEIGEEFVEFLEKELKINEESPKSGKTSESSAWRETLREEARNAAKKAKGPEKGPRDTKADKEKETAEIEDMLAQLKKEIGK